MTKPTLGPIEFPEGDPPYTKKVLDHGFVKLHNLAGPVDRYTDGFTADDIDPAMTARMSFDRMGEDRTRQADLKLAKYLMEHKHTTPFEMIEVWLEMKLPIFLARQFVRHRTCTINEVSARYVQLPAEWYIPEVVGKKPDKAKQGQSEGLYWQTQAQFKEDLNEQCRKSYQLYESYILTDVAPEHARLFLHLNHYTHWMWKQDLHNLMHFLSLRVDSHAQIEARVFANAIIDLIRPHLPHSMELFDKFRRLMPADVPLHLPSSNTGEMNANINVETEIKTMTDTPAPSIAETAAEIARKIDEVNQNATSDFEQKIDQHVANIVPPYEQIVSDLRKPGADIIKDLLPRNAQALHMAVGISKEAAELLFAVKAGDGPTIVEETGDLEFYILGAAQVADVGLVHRDYFGAVTNYDLNELMFAAGALLDAGNRLGMYGDDSKWKLYTDCLIRVRVEMDKFYAVSNGLSRDMAISNNMEKLVTGPKARYKDGKYSNAAAQNRADKDGALDQLKTNS